MVRIVKFSAVAAIGISSVALFGTWSSVNAAADLETITNKVLEKYRRLILKNDLTYGPNLSCRSILMLKSGASLLVELINFS
jgi:hypothetical protein